MASTKKKTTKKKVTKRKKSVKKKAEPKKPSLGKYSQWAQTAHTQWVESVRQLAKTQKIGTMKGLVVERVTEGPQVRYWFEWRGLPEGVTTEQLIDVCVTTFELMEWPEAPAIAVQLQAEGQFQVIFTW